MVNTAPTQTELPFNLLVAKFFSFDGEGARVTKQTSFPKGLPNVLSIPRPPLVPNFPLDCKGLKMLLIVRPPEGHCFFDVCMSLSNFSS